MTYHLHCVVNAAGTPYGETFSNNPEKAWEKHWWASVPKDGCGPNSCTGATAQSHQEQLRANGDRVVPVTVYTQEIVELIFP
jgi:hypothetical protein